MTKAEFEPLVAGLISPLYRFALARTRDRDLAQEAVQETLVAALEHCATFAGRSALRTWMTAILKHKIVDQQRALQRNTLDWSGSISDIDDRPAPESIWSNPERAYEHKRLTQAMTQAAARLPDAAARVFHLRDVLGWSTDQVSAQLGITPNNCCVILHRARNAMRISLGECGFGGNL